MSASTRAAKLLARPMYWLSVIASPFVWILAKSTSLIFNLLHINTAEEKVTEEEIKSMIDEGTENGEVQEVEQDIVDRVSPWRPQYQHHHDLSQRHRIH